MPVPYNLDIELYALSKNSDDALQIVEQILPYFQPDYTITVNDMPDMGIKRDVPIVLNSIGYEDDYQGNFEARRAIIYTLSFTAKFYLYGTLLLHNLLLRVCKSISILIYQIIVHQDNKDIQLPLVQQLLTQTMILDLTKQQHSLRMLKTLIRKVEQINDEKGR